MTDHIRPQPGIMEIALYEGGAAHVAGVSDAIKLSSNENPFGPSDRAKEAYLRAVHRLHRYPATDHAALRQAIGDVHGLDPSRIICGVGSDPSPGPSACGWCAPSTSPARTPASSGPSSTAASTAPGCSTPR